MEEELEMKKKHAIMAALMASAMVLTPCMDVYAKAAADGNTQATGSDYETWKNTIWDAGSKNDWTKVSITPGADETSINLAWYSDGTSSLIYGKNADLSDAINVSIDSITTTQTDKSGITYISNKATISGLSANTTYYYQVAGKDIESFTTGDSSNFTFAFVGDPQIGSSNPLKGADTEEFYNAQSDAVSSDSYNWAHTLELIKEAGSDFVVSAGDQIQTTKKKSPGKSSTVSEIEYAGYLSPETLTSLPVATTVGNHDADNANYTYHFNVPNQSSLGDNGKVGGDYYFIYGNVLFMMLNTQDTNSAEHIEFIKNTVESNQNVKWKVVTLHQDIYGSAEHSNEPEIVNLRYALTPVFEECGVDVVLTGHDHAYSRSKFLSGDQTVANVTYTDDEFDAMLDIDIDYSGEGTLFTSPANISDDTTDASERAYLDYLTSIMDENRITGDDTEYTINPKGILYLTASSSSGSKYYDLVARKQSYIENRWQEDVPTYSLINVNGDSLTINTYRTDNNSLIDNTVTIIKTDSNTDDKNTETGSEDADNSSTISGTDSTVANSNNNSSTDVASDNAAKNKTTVSPATGDKSRTILYSLSGILAIMTMAITILQGKKYIKKEN